MFTVRGMVIMKVSKCKTVYDLNQVALRLEGMVGHLEERIKLIRFYWGKIPQKKVLTKAQTEINKLLEGK